ncbi:MAG TPA: cytochrome C class I [Gammaproteobacteria bacterium]|mgnify:FL=1|jgi:mono/diheme cytochrome c family protein|nr:cytochrome C class I [Acidiferrobacteraceae bacterium]MDP6397696.1 cytochrome c [Arenicellales bacterium]MDP6551164.1 cytochrome c [Arenicellales bacterium]MDP6918964.1 cytochrome c [Arenicellales bacterium]HCX87881.1 cytochrome C class I [Gammaproteobacteria bacterium]|tara:strand:+ start:373 stop:741 length:369 start_codon:yes stop_codon:yes gene_type:complete
MTRRFLTALLALALGPGIAGSTLAADGETLFRFYCAQCHGIEGKGDGPNVTGDFPVDPRDFTKTAEMNKLSDADIRNVIIDGGPIADKSPMMPPWGKTLNDAEIKALVEYLRQLCNCTGKTG